MASVIFTLIKFFITSVVPFLYVLISSPTNNGADVYDMYDWLEKTIGCNPFTDTTCNIISSDVCIGCDLLSKMLEIFSTHATYALDFLSKMSLELLLIFFVLWTVYYTFNTLINADNGTTAKSYIQQIIGTGSKVLVVAVLLGAFTGSNFMKPIARGYTEPVIKIGTVVSLKVFNLDSKICDNYAPTNPKDDDVFSNEMKKDFLCYVSSVSLLMMAGMQAGGQIMSLGLSNLNFFHMISGYWIFLAFFFLASYVLFQLIDILLSILIPVFMLPILFMAWVFNVGMNTAKSWFMQYFVGSIVNVTLYMITLSISFLIVYGVYTHIGDRYYPGPVDGYSYIFADFFTNHQTEEGRKAKQQHVECMKLLRNQTHSVMGFKTWTFKANTENMSSEVLKCNESLPTPSTSLGLMGLLMIIALSKLTQKIFEYIKSEIGLGQPLMIGAGGMLQSFTKYLLDKGKALLNHGFDFVKGKVMKK